MAWWRAYGPAMARPAWTDLLRGGIGAGVGLLLAALAVYLAEDSSLLAPLGASAVMVFAIPNSPLAQPWSVVIGNCVSTVLALGMVALLPEGQWLGPLAVTVALLSMHGLRALHPPGGAMAFLVALGAAGEPWVTLGIAALGSVVLVGVAMLWHSVTGRVYPFRQPGLQGPHGTRDAAPEIRLGVDPADLAAILETYRQSANLGVADLARLVGAVEQAAAARRMESFTAADIMSRDLVTVGPDAPLSQVAEVFRTSGFTSLPVVEGDRLLGLIFQIDLIRRARDDAFRQRQSLIRAFAHLIDTHRRRPPKAGEIMETDTPRVSPDTPVGALMPLLADGGAEAVPVVDGPIVVGIVTRTDLVSALTKRLALSAD